MREETTVDRVKEKTKERIRYKRGKYFGHLY